MIKRETNIRLIYECRCDERLKDTDEGVDPSSVSFSLCNVRHVSHGLGGVGDWNT